MKWYCYWLYILSVVSIFVPWCWRYKLVFSIGWLFFSILWICTCNILHDINLDLVNTVIFSCCKWFIFLQFPICIIYHRMHRCSNDAWLWKWGYVVCCFSHIVHTNLHCTSLLWRVSYFPLQGIIFVEG